MNTLWSHRLAVVLFGLGLLLGIAVAGVVAWGDMEGIMFDAAISPDATLNTLRCPVLLTAAETSTVSAAFSNPLDRPIELFVRAHISAGFVTMMREDTQRLPLEPGETKWLSWPISPADAAFNRVILVRVHVLRNGPLPYRAGTCGIVVVNVPFLTGNLLLAITLTVALLGVGGGIGLWVAHHRPLVRQGLAVMRAMGVLAGLITLAIIVGLFGMWLIGLVLLLFTVLLIVVMAAYAVTRAQ